MIYIGYFVHATNQEKVDERDRRHGEFNMVIEAPDAATAVDMFKQRLVKYQTESDLFEGAASIYLVQLFEFDRFPDHEAMLLSYKSVAGDPAMPFIRCTVPGQEGDSCRIFDWTNNQPQVDGQGEKLFLSFNPS